MQRISKDIWRIVIFCCFFSGMMQLPLANRYAISTLPFLTWTGNAIIVYQAHILCATALLFLLAYKLVSHKDKIQINGYFLVKTSWICLAIVTGLTLFLNNLLAWDFDPLLSRILVFVHLFSILLWGLITFIFLLLKLFYPKKLFDEPHNPS